MSATANTVGPQSFVERCSTCTLDETCGFYGHPELQHISERRFYGRHFTVTRQGDPAAKVYIVCSGWLQLTHLTPTGRIVSQIAGPDTILGLTGVMTESEYMYSARTLEESELQQIEREAFLTFIQDNPKVSVQLLKTMSRQWQRLLQRFYELSSKVPAEARLLRTLREISETCGNPMNGGIRIRVPLSVQVLADTVGCSRQWVSKLLGNLEEKGLIRHKSGWITVNYVGLRSRR